jgi:hypothetical protein
MSSKLITVFIGGELLIPEIRLPIAFADRLEKSITDLEDQQTALTVTSTPKTLRLDFEVAGKVPDCLRYRYNPRVGFTPVGERVEFKGQTFPMGVAEFEAEPYIAVLLESPHIEEVKHLLPAMGATGLVFDQRLAYIQHVLDNDLGMTGTDIPVVFRNPVPFASSCLLKGDDRDAKSWRDLIFNVLITRPGMVDDFVDRLHVNDKDNAPVVIINACTGRHRRQVRRCTPKDYVRQVLDDHVGAGDYQQLVYRRRGTLTYPPVRLVYDYDLSLKAPTKRIPIVELPHPSRWGEIEVWFPDQG